MGEQKDAGIALCTELRRGMLALCVLSQTEQPRYGYALVQILEQSGIDADPNTLYPLLRRLEAQGLLQSRWDTADARPRKYYCRTAQGEQVYRRLRAQWQQLCGAMTQLLSKEET